MSQIFDYWTRDACVFPGCDEPPTDDRETCALHRNVTVSSWGSWLNATEVEG